MRCAKLATEAGYQHRHAIGAYGRRPFLDAELKTCLRRGRGAFHRVIAASDPEIGCSTVLPLGCEPPLNAEQPPNRAQARETRRCVRGQATVQAATPGTPAGLLLAAIWPSETDRQTNEWIDPICRGRHANVHSSIQLDIFGQLVREARSEDDRITS